MNNFYKKYFKRVIDFSGSFFLLMILLPLLLVIIIFLSFYYKGNPFFTQRRPGLNTRIFKVIKFKSMKDIFDGNGNPLPNKDRVTNIGRLLRKTSIDEIPQLFNIIKGDMSFIGPRPLFEQYLPFYTDQEKLRHSVRPGISGLAQISGRNLLEWEQRLVLDVEYATNISFMLDFNIFIKTIKKVFKSEGISVIPQMKPLHIVRQQQTTKN